MHPISQDLAIATKPGTWEPIGDFTEEDITELRHDAANEVRHSRLGQQLFARGGAGIFDRVLEVFAERMGPPSVSPFFESFVQAANDVLVTLPPSPKIPSESLPKRQHPRFNPLLCTRQDAQAAQDAVRDQRTKDLNKFKHWVNAALAYGGPSCLTPKNGYIVLKYEDNGRLHEHKIKYGNGTGDRDHNGNLITSDEYNAFMQDFEEATKRGLIQ
jgi:hypothetical protein